MIGFDKNMDVQNIEEKSANALPKSNMNATSVKRNKDQINIQQYLKNEPTEGLTSNMTQNLTNIHSNDHDESQLSQLPQLRKEMVTPISKINKSYDSEGDESFIKQTQITSEYIGQKYNIGENYSNNIQTLKKDMNIFDDDDDEEISTRERIGDKRNKATGRFNQEISLNKDNHLSADDEDYVDEDQIDIDDD